MQVLKSNSIGSIDKPPIINLFKLIYNSSLTVSSRFTANLAAVTSYCCCVSFAIRLKVFNQCGDITSSQTFLPFQIKNCLLQVVIFVNKMFCCCHFLTNIIRFISDYVNAVALDAVFFYVQHWYEIYKLKQYYFLYIRA